MPTQNVSMHLSNKPSMLHIKHKQNIRRHIRPKPKTVTTRKNTPPNQQAASPSPLGCELICVQNLPDNRTDFQPLGEGAKTEHPLN